MRPPKQSRVVVIDPPGPTIEYNAYKLGAVAFEELCCALLRLEPHMQSADLYGRPRQDQYGVDVIGTLRHRRGIDVVSCKCYSEVSKGEIATFARDFLKHWRAHWRAKKVRRFILAIPAEVRSLERLEELAQAAKRFAKVRVRFEVWHKRELTHRIRSNKDIRREFFREWSPSASAAGAQPVGVRSEPPTTASLSALIVSQLHGLQSALGDSVGVQLDQYTDALRRGAKLDVVAALTKLRRNKGHWTALPSTIQARALRMLALQTMDSVPLARAERLLKEADALAPSTGRRFSALLALHKHGPKQGLAILGTPSTQEENLVHAGLLLEDGRASEALSALRQWQSKSKQDPEWRRLMACATFALGRRSTGLEHIRAAEKLAPEWTSVIRTGAVLRYGAALSPAAQFHVTRLPEPLNRDLILQDDESQQLVKEALASFEQLSNKALNADDREEFDAWKLACLSNLVGREKAASALCVSLSKRQPLQTAPVFWGLTRGYPIDRTQVIRRLEIKLRARRRSVDDLQALLACFITAGEIEKARHSLARYSQRFTDASSRQIIASWRTRLSIKTAGQISAAARTEPFFALENLITKARMTKDWRALEPFLKSIDYRPDVAFAACQALAANGRWQDIKAHIDLLLDSVRSAEATRLAIYTQYNTEAFDHALKTLQEYSLRFAGGVLPQDLERIRVYSAARLGDLLEARAMASKLARESHTVQDQLFAAQIHIRGGDVSGALPFIRDVMARGDSKPAQLLQFVPSVFIEDKELARQLMQRALAQNLNSQQGVFAMEWAFKLGLQREANHLLSMLSARNDGTNGALRTASLDEVLEHLKQRRKTADEIIQRYNRGGGPIHVVAGAVNMNLASIWRNAFESPGIGGILFVRNANRSTDFFNANYPPAVTLALDITALLTAEWLGLLDVLEGSRINLTMPQSLIAALQQLEQDAHHHQPKRMETVQKVIDYVAAHPGSLMDSSSSPGPTATSHANETAGQTGSPEVAASLSPPTQSPLTAAARVVFELLPDEAEAQISLPRITLGTLGAEIVRRGGTTAKELAAVRTRFSGFEVSGQETSASSLRTLLFVGNTIDTMIDAGLLEAASSCFEVRVETEHHERCLAELRSWREQEAMAERLRRLRRRIAEGVDRGRYTFLPRPSRRGKSQRRTRSKDEFSLEVVLDLLALPPHEASPPAPESPPHETRWLWIDDRFVTGYTRGNGNPIVSVYEVLRYLNDSGSVSEDQFFEFLGVLRRANVSFLPVTVAEVIYRLARAELGDEGLVETRELADVRVALNQLLLLETDLDLNLTNAPRDRVDETPALVLAFRVARECLEDIWKERDVPIATRIAKSEWVWEALRVERFSRLPPSGDVNSKRHLWQLAIEQLLIVGLSVPVQADGEIKDGALRGYNRWLESELLELQPDGDPVVLERLASMLGDSLVQLLKPLGQAPSESKVALSDARRILTRFVEGLPRQLRQRVYQVPELQSTLKPDVITVLTLGTLQFRADAFWSAMELAWNDEPSEVSAITGQRFNVSRERDDLLLSGEPNMRFTDEDLALLGRDEAKRRASVRDRQALLINAMNEAAAVVSQIAGLASPFERMRLVRELRENSTAGRYARVAELLESKTEFAASELFPARADRYVAFLGLKVENDAKPDWERLTSQMMADVGVRELFTRWAGLPVVFQSGVAQHLRRLDEQSTASLINDLRQRAITPLRRLKLLQMLTDLDPILHGPVINSAVEEVVATWKADASAFNALLLWSERVWSHDREWHALPNALRIACVWAHADRVLSLFAARGISSHFVEERFSNLHPSTTRDLLSFDLNYESDVGAPKRMSMETLLLYGLNATLDGKSESLLQRHHATIISYITHSLETGQFPVAGLFADRRDGKDSLGTFLTTELDAWYAQLISAGGITLLSTTGRDEMRAHAVGLVQSDPRSPAAWVQIAMVGLPWLPANARERIEEALEHFTFPSSEDDWIRTAFALSSMLPFCAPRRREALERELVRWTRTLAKNYKGLAVRQSNESPVDRAAVSVMELAFALARTKDTRPTLLALNRIVQSLVQTWPALGPRLRDIVTRILRECSSTDGEVLWEAFVALRSRR